MSVEDNFTTDEKILMYYGFERLLNRYTRFKTMIINKEVTEYLCIHTYELDVPVTTQEKMREYIGMLLGDCKSVYQWLGTQVKFWEYPDTHSPEKMREIMHDYRVRWIKHMMESIQNSMKEA